MCVCVCVYVYIGQHLGCSLDFQHVVDPEISFKTSEGPHVDRVLLIGEEANQPKTITVREGKTTVGRMVSSTNGHHILRHCGKMKVTDRWCFRLRNLQQNRKFADFHRAFCACRSLKATVTYVKNDVRL